MPTSRLRFVAWTHSEPRFPRNVTTSRLTTPVGRERITAGVADAYGPRGAQTVGDQAAPGGDAHGGHSTSDPHRLARSVYGLAQGRGTASLRILDLGVIGGAWLLAFLAGFGGAPTFNVRQWILYLLIPTATQLIFNQCVGLYGPVWRYASIEEAMRVVAAVVGGTVIATLDLAWVSNVRGVTLPLLSAPPLAALLILLGCGGIRFQARLFALERQRDGKSARHRTLIVGATDEGLELALELSHRAYSGDVIIGFVDDNQETAGRTLCGKRVLGTTDDIGRIRESERVDRILIALPDASRDRLRGIVSHAL